MSDDKKRWPLAEARAAAEQLCELLREAANRIEIAGSIRRGRPDVGDIEILYIPRTAQRKEDWFSDRTFNLFDEFLDKFISAGILARRRNVKGSEIWGPKNKLAVHCATGIPVDLFAATAENWWNLLVCRTGPAESNTNIAMAAQRRGMKWSPYSPGFQCSNGDLLAVHSEAEVFETVGMTPQPPDKR